VYTVRVINVEIGESTDERDFEYGTWQEIGLWLDHYGYNVPRYKVEIRFVG